MRDLTHSEKERLWEAVRKEFPDDDMMQEVHYVRLLHYHQSQGLSPRERVDFYACGGAESPPTAQEKICSNIGGF